LRAEQGIEVKEAAWLMIAMAFMSLCIGLLILIGDVRRDIDQSTADLHALVLPTQKAEADIAAASLAIAQVTAKERNAFDAQNAYFTKLSAQTDATFGEINGKLIPQLVASANSLNSSLSGLRDLESGGVSVEHSVQQATTEIAPLMRALTARVNDSQYDAILRHADASMANLETMSVNGARATTDIADFTHRELAPVKGTWNLIKHFLMEFAGPGAQVATAIK
jgi:hypothetical protein